jgi:hypothetical protein
MKKFILVLIVGLISIVGLCAPKDSPWREIQTVVIPQNTEVFFGTTKSGNPKAWIEIPQVGKVAVSPKSAEKFQNGEVKLELVKWYRDDTKAYKYSVRQVKDSKTSNSSSSKNIDLNKVF